MAPTRALVTILFLLSGATGLVYEVAWTRLFSVVFGVTALAVSAVLASFMGGLAIGSRLFGGLIDRRGEELRVYGFLELGIAAAAVLLLPALELASRLLTWVYREYEPSFWTMSLLRFAMSFVLLIVPTALMGGTLPVLVRFWTRSREDVGRSLGRLYALNTFGAMLGCLAGGFWMVAAFGVRQTVWITAGVNVVIGIVALVAGLRRSRAADPAAATATGGEVPADRRAATANPAAQRLALAAIGLSGFLALAYEVVWTRVLMFMLSTSIHAFAIMLSTFLAGLATGSLVLAGRAGRLRNGMRVFGWLEIAIGVAALATIAVMTKMPQILDALLIWLQVRSWEGLVRARFLLAAIVIFLPTFLMGMTFPLVSQICAGQTAKLGRRIGSMIAINTAGAVLGSFAAGFLLIPWLGTQATLVALSVANALLGGALLIASRRAGAGERRGVLSTAVAFVPAVILLGVGLVLPKNAFLPVFANNLRDGEVVYAREGITGTVTIHQAGSARLLSINGVDVAGTTFMLRTTQKLQAHIPLLLHPDPRDVLQVGLGSGETAHSILLHPIRQLVGCDISPEVIEAGPHFEAINGSVYKDPRLKIVIEDAKSYVASTDRKFDLILNDSVHPIFRGSSDLYAREYFEACRGRLRDGGMMSSWFPIALLAEEDLLLLMRTFHEVFPTSTVWVATNAITRNALLLGWKDDGPLSIDVQDILPRLWSPAIQEDLAGVRLNTLPALLDAFMLDPAAIHALTRDAGINTYDRPHLEFSAPKVLARGDRLVWSKNFETIASHRSPVLPYLVNFGEDPEAAARLRERFAQRAEASRSILRGLQLELEGEHADLAQAAYREALAVFPEDPLASGLVQRESHLRAAAEASLAAGSTDPDAYELVARWRRESGDLQGAIDLLRRAVELQPEFLRAHVELAQALIESGDLVAAEAAIDRVLELDARAPEGWAIRGRIRAQLGDLAGAEEDLVRASRQGAKLPWAELLLGKILIEKGRVEEGREHLRKAVALAPDSPAGREAQELLAK